jgi:UDP-glucose 4-epimerase
MKILVTGGAGYIGSHTVVELLDANYDVVIIDTNHVLSEFNITLMDICDEVLMLISNDLLDFKNMRNVIKIFNDTEKRNFKVMLNESVNPYRKYYSVYDIKNTIKANIDYTLPSEFFIKTMPSYVSDGTILTLDKKFPKIYPKVWKTFNTVCNDLIEVEDEK